MIGSDVVTCAGTATFDTASVGTGKTVTVTGITLSGGAAGNYALSSHDRDDHGEHHGGDADGDGDGGEQGLRRHDGDDGRPAR